MALRDRCAFFPLLFLQRLAVNVEFICSRLARASDMLLVVLYRFQ